MADNATLTHDDVRAIADLARLQLSDEEVAKYAEQLSAILHDFQKLQAVDTSHIDPIASVLPLKSVMREDTPLPALKPEAAVSNAPDKDANQFRVKAVLDGDGSA
ncbi:MAG: Asp-tRNA(Asn)/Glu-tRNA(Gln) amidotransferase subunit GatC [Anaerolineae bacterium]|nr:Asp-tRNA(Asn)/Glu-tRNA(Gln) amidotransferase subunit GatC [Anaerolineae bacterium]MCA9890940.1 Asp-tRNA(Asn)/Glu-tRNA(Gln) amidotransferase subunit GatC [Anaerolineae bacterium]